MFLCSVARPDSADAGSRGLEERGDGIERLEVVACEGEFGEDEEVEVLGGGISEDVIGEGEVVVNLADLGRELETADTHFDGSGGGVSGGYNACAPSCGDAPVDRTQVFVGGSG